jgi:predicted nucleotidyltransferase
MADGSVVDVVRKYLGALTDSGILVDFAVIFGSHASNTADEWSDMDLLVVSPAFDNQSSRRHVDLLWRLAARIDNRIEPVPCGAARWCEDRTSPLLEMVRREGEQVVWSAPETNRR